MLYTMLAFYKRTHAYETMGSLFAHLKDQLIEAAIAERLWLVFLKLQKIMAEILKIDINEYFHKLINSERAELLLRSFSNSDRNPTYKKSASSKRIFPDPQIPNLPEHHHAFCFFIFHLLFNIFYYPFTRRSSPNCSVKPALSIYSSNPTALRRLAPRAETACGRVNLSLSPKATFSFRQYCS